MSKQVYICLLVSIAFATGAQFAFAQSGPNQIPNPGRPSLSGGIENNNGQLRLNLTNNSPREFRGTGVIGLGGDSEQKDIGQLALALPPGETTLLQLSGVSPSGNQFSLKIFDQSGVVAFYKIAPIKHVSDSTPAIAVTLSPVSKQRDITVSSSKPSSPNAAATVNPAAVAAPAIAEVTIKGRLLAGQSETDPFVVAFEMTAARPIYDAALSITLGKFKDRKPVSLNRNLTVEFKLPEEFDSERIGYELTAQNGRVIAKGELDLDQLMAEDFVTVADIRTDKSSYEPGESVQVTVLLEGQSPNGYRLEILVKDGQGNSVFRDQYQTNGDNQPNTQGFTVSLPREISSPVMLEFKIYDHETGRLFDSGEREIPINDPKRKP